MTWYSEWLKRFSNTLSKDKKEWIDKKIKEAEQRGYAQGKKESNGKTTVC